MSAVSGVMVIFLPFQRSSTVMSFSAVRMLSMKLAGTLVVSFGMKILIFLPLAALRIWSCLFFQNWRSFSSCLIDEPEAAGADFTLVTELPDAEEPVE